MHVGLFGVELGYDLNYFPFPYNATPPSASAGHMGLLGFELGCGMNPLLQMITLFPKHTWSMELGILLVVNFTNNSRRRVDT